MDVQKSKFMDWIKAKGTINFKALFSLHNG